MNSSKHQLFFCAFAVSEGWDFSGLLPHLKVIKAGSPSKSDDWKIYIMFLGVDDNFPGCTISGITQNISGI